MSKTLAALILLPSLMILMIPVGLGALVIAGNSVSMSPTFAAFLAATTIATALTVIQCVRALVKKS